MMGFDYLREKRRMLDSIGRVESICSGVECADCPFSKRSRGSEIGCAVFEMRHPDEATKIVREWADRHPVQTRIEYFKKCFPLVRENSVRGSCSKYYFDSDPVATSPCQLSCEECWDMPFYGW